MDFFTLGYTSFQVVVLVFVLVIMWKNNGWYAHTNTVASILTVIGVLGTFIGIYIGLRAFKTDLGNMEEMQKSISTLLNGLKSAFLTSIFGIASALLLKGIISPLVQSSQKKSDDDPEQNARNEFGNALKEAFSFVETIGEKNLSTKLDSLIKTINDNSKTTQGVLSNMANDLTNVQNTLPQKLDTLTNTVSDEHKQLRADRETTRSVLGEMRDNLSDSQGKIFDQLDTLTTTVSEKNDLIITSQKNEATETRKLLTDIQSELTNRQNKAFIQLRTLTKTVSYEHNQLRKEFDNFSKNVAESITELATKELISSLTKVIDQFNTQLSTQFGDNFKQLNEAVGKTVAWQEQYRQQMDELAAEFKIAAASIDNSRDSLKNIENSTSEIADKSNRIVTCATKLEPILHTLNDQLGAFSKLRQEANDAFPVIKQNLTDLTTSFSNDVKGVITESSKSIRHQQLEVLVLTQQLKEDFKDLDKTIEEELTKSINILAGNLVGLSNRFVEDYTPLTNELRKVIEIANRI